MLDVFHASQHIASAGAALHGEGTPEAAGWTEGCRSRLLADGWPGLLDHLGETSGPGREGIDGLIGYFAAHTDWLGYFGRLRLGQSIGSWAVEGLYRRLGRRLKVPGRGWDPGHIERMATLVIAAGSSERDGLRSRPAA